MAESVKAATMEEFKQTPYYQGLGIDALEDRLAGIEQDEGEIKSQAEAQYRPAYEQERENARHAFEKELAGYRAQMAGAGADYDRQRRKADRAYEESAAELNNQLTKRGLGRSSLVSAQGAYLQNQRNQALAEIDRAEGDAIRAINEKIALLTEQAAQKERTMADNYVRQLDARVSEMKEKNKNASISLQLQIAALQQQGYEAYQEWLLKNRKQEVEEKEFEAEYGEMQNAEASSGSASPSGGGGSKKAAAKETKQPTAALGAAAGSAVGALSGGIKKLVAGLSKGIQAAAAAQKQTAAKASSGGAKHGKNSFHQKIKE